jgi:polysaccharide export outer membrane protein
MRARHFWLYVFVFSLFLAGCAGKRAVNSVDTKVWSQKKDKKEYVLDSGDQLSIRVWRQDDLNRDVIINSEGAFYYPLVGRVQAQGKTVDELRKSVQSQLQEYLVHPQVEIGLTEAGSLKVYVLGEVRQPGTQLVDPGITVLEAYANAGGATPDADLARVVLIRSEQAGLRVDLLNLKLQNPSEQTISPYSALQRHDLVYVPKSNIASLESFMKRLQTILQPLLSIERGVILSSEVKEAFHGGTDARVVISP